MLEEVEPLGAQCGVFPAKALPDPLVEPLFGEPEPNEADRLSYKGLDAVPLMKTYAILDAAKWPYLLTALLESSGLKYQCLFQGKASEEFKEAAPYLVELDKENALTRKLFTGPEGVNGLWDRSLGILVRSRARFDDIRAHFRKFTRMQDQEGKWYFFAFWSAKNAPAYFEALVNNPEKTAQWFKLRNGETLESIYSFWVADRSVSTVIRANWVAIASSSPRVLPLLTEEEMQSFADMRQISFLEDLGQHCRSKFPEMCASWTGEELQDKLRIITKNASQFGLTKRAPLIVFTELSFVFGDNFFQQAWAEDILKSNKYSGQMPRIKALYRGGTVRLPS